MTLHGDAHPFTIVARVSRSGNIVKISCSFTVPYVAWGLEDPSILSFRVAKEVKVQATTVASLRRVSP